MQPSWPRVSRTTWRVRPSRRPSHSTGDPTSWPHSASAMTDQFTMHIDAGAQARTVARSLLRSMGQPFTPEKLRIAASAGAAAAHAAAAAIGDELTLDVDQL